MQQLLRNVNNFFKNFSDTARALSKKLAEQEFMSI